MLVDREAMIVILCSVQCCKAVEISDAPWNSYNTSICLYWSHMIAKIINQQERGTRPKKRGLVICNHES